jgi:hypothetical protein
MCVGEGFGFREAREFGLFTRFSSCLWLIMCLGYGDRFREARGFGLLD